MIGQQITGANGIPIVNGKKLSQSNYQPLPETAKLFAKVQQDYQTAYSLQHRPFDEFDGLSLLDRTRRDQETFAAFVGAKYVPAHKAWRWRGRKNTARNKLIGILTDLLAAMLFPFVMATNDKDEEDKMTARVMRILIEEKLRKAGYEMQFMFIVLSALVNPAVFTKVETVQAVQRVKQRLANGSIQIVEAVDEIMSGLNLHIIPVDQVLLADFYTFNIQRQPNIILVRRISFDEARSIYKGRFFSKTTGEDLFDYVVAGQTRVVLAGQENQTLFDIEWTEADGNFVQEITALYRGEDLQVTYVGGVFMGEEEDIYNANPFEHRRMSVSGNTAISVPVYPIAKSGFQPIDPNGRFAYYKSGAFLEYWDDHSANVAHGMIHDGTYLDVIKPIFMTGVGKMDSTVMVPGATVGLPQGATVTPYSLGPNIAAAYQLLTKQEQDMAASTQDKVDPGNTTTPGVSATAVNQAVQSARRMLGLFGLMIATMVSDIGYLVVDDVIQYDTVGELDATVPESMNMKYKTFIARGMEKGKKVTNKIIFNSALMGRELSDKDKEDIEWGLYKKAGGHGTNQYIFMVNPFKFARSAYTLWVDPDQILDKSSGSEQQRKLLAFNILSDPRVAPYTNQQNVVDDFVIDEFSDGDPDRYKKSAGDPNAMINAMMGQPGQSEAQPQPGQAPVQMPSMGAVAPPSALPSPYSLPVTSPQ